MLRNRNVFFKKKKKKKDVCCIVSFRFTVFRNKHISNFFVCFILFQRFSTISYSFHLLRNRNGFIKKKTCMFHRFIPFHPVSKRALNKSFGLLHPVSEFFLYILIVSFVTKQKWVYKKRKKKKKDVCFIVSFCFTLFRNEHILNFLVYFILSFPYIS